MRDRQSAARIGIIVYDGIEPIDLGGTLGVISMARRVLPNLADAVIAGAAGPVRMTGGLTIDVPFGAADAPHCDIHIVCGGAGWPDAARDHALLALLQRSPPERLASVCTGALILAAAGTLDDRRATTRRSMLGSETISPLAVLGQRARGVRPEPAQVVDDVVITGGGVSLAIDCTLYVIGKLYDRAAQEAVARAIEYDRAYAANAAFFAGTVTAT